MKRFCILILLALVGHFAFCKQQLNNNRRVQTKLTNQKIQNSPKERRLSFDDELQTGSMYVQQLENTNANLNEMTGHSRLQSSMKKVGQWFGDIEERLDDFRDSVARKLNELHMSLQRPKIPIMGPAAMMLHPSMNPALPNTLNGANGGFMPNANPMGSMIGPQVHSEYFSPIVRNSQVGNSVLKSAPSMIGSDLYSSVAKPDERMLLQARNSRKNRQNML